jgi:hypothetical protein
MATSIHEYIRSKEQCAIWTQINWIRTGNSWEGLWEPYLKGSLTERSDLLKGYQLVIKHRYTTGLQKQETVTDIGSTLAPNNLKVRLLCKQSHDDCLLENLNYLPTRTVTTDYYSSLKGRTCVIIHSQEEVMFSAKGDDSLTKLTAKICWCSEELVFGFFNPQPSTPYIPNVAANDFNFFEQLKESVEGQNSWTMQLVIPGVSPSVPVEALKDLAPAWFIQWWENLWNWRIIIKKWRCHNSGSICKRHIMKLSLGTYCTPSTF